MGVVVPGLIRVLMANGQVVVMKLETYLAGVVFCEIGANGPLEALKAQAVASRTYAASAHRHPELGADVCTTAHCQEWKRVDPIVAPEVFRAVSETWGIVAIHDGRLIDAFFFEHCDGHTRSSEDVLMPAVPYLRGVDCACGFVAMKGHGVGLCQRGAIVMARRGASFEQILRHYYRDVVVIHTSLEPGQTSASRPVPRSTANRETAPAHSDGATKKVPASTIRPKLRSTRKLPTPANPAPKPISSPTAGPTAPVEPEEPSVLPVAPVPEQQLHSQPAEVSETVPTPAQEFVAAETPPSVSLDKLPAPDILEQPVLATEPEPQVPITIEPALVPDSSDSQNESPVAIEPGPVLEASETPMKTAVPAVQGEAAELNEEMPQPIPVHVERLAGPVLLTTEQTRAPAPTVEPADDRVSTPVIHESELPALHESVLVKTPRMHVDHLPGGRMIAGCLPSAGIVVRIHDRHGNETLVFSGSAAHYGEGGFETIVGEDGPYLVVIGEEQVEVKVQGDTVFIHPL